MNLHRSLFSRKPPLGLHTITWLGACLILLSACGSGGGGGLLGGGSKSVSLDVDALGTDSIRLKWSKPGGGLSVSAYGVSRDDERSGQMLAWTEERSYVVTGLEPDTRYCFVIKMPITANKMSKTKCARTRADEVPPSPPRDLQVVAENAGTISLRWQRATDQHGIANYLIHRDGTPLGSTPSTSYLDSKAATATEHCYEVFAVDRADNRSRSSARACATTPQDIESPQAVSNLRAEFQRIDGIDTLRVTWAAATDDGRIDYYRLNRDGALLTNTEETAHDDEAIAGDDVYCYTVVAVDSTGKTSPESDSVCARSGWTSQRLEARDARWAELAIASDDGIGIAFKVKEYDSSEATYLVKLKFLQLNQGGVSRSRTVDSGEDTYWFSDSYLLALSFDSFDVPNIVHKQRNGSFERVRHLELSPQGLYGLRNLQDSDNPMNSVALASAPDGTQHLCYGIRDTLYYATFTGSEWLSREGTELHPDATGSSCDIAVDRDGNAHLSYLNPSLGLMYLSNVSGTWQAEAIPGHSGESVDDSSTTAIAVDPERHAHIAYDQHRDAEPGEVGYASNSGGSWQAELVGTGRYPELAISAEGTAHLVFEDDSDDDQLLYARNDTDGWKAGPLWSIGWGKSSIAVDSQGHAHVIVASDSEGDMRYLSNRPVE